MNIPGGNAISQKEQDHSARQVTLPTNLLPGEYAAGLLQKLGKTQGMSGHMDSAFNVR